MGKDVLEPTGTGCPRVWWYPEEGLFLWGEGDGQLGKTFMGMGLEGEEGGSLWLEYKVNFFLRERLKKTL